jgi:hypothetical protein
MGCCAFGFPAARNEMLRRAHTEGVTSLAASTTDPRLIVSGGGDGDVHVFELGTWRRLRSIATRSPVKDIAVRGHRLAIATERGFIVVGHFALGATWSATD